MEQYFKSTECQLVNEEIYENKCCGKLYCCNCIRLLVNDKSICCDRQMSFQKNLFAQRMLKSIKLTCRYNCGKQFASDEMKKHYLTCEKRIYTCQYDDCKFTGERKQLLVHSTLEHSLSLLILMENYDAFEEEFDEIGKEKVIQKPLNSGLNMSDSIEDNLFSINNPHRLNRHSNSSFDDLDYSLDLPRGFPRDYSGYYVD